MLFEPRQYLVLPIIKMIEPERKAVEIYLRVKGPRDPTNVPHFKLLANDTQIRFKERDEGEQQEIMAEFVGAGIYKYEKVYREDCEQVEIFENVAKDIIESAFEGYNGTVFAYGQTGSGKTYTMTGGDDDPSTMGLIPRAIDYLFKEAEVREDETIVRLRYLQIYKGKGYDLLHPEAKKFKKLEDLPQVRPITKGDGFDFQNLSQIDASSFQEAMKIFEYGETNRMVCKTPSNDHSSRSHCILMVMVRTKSKETGLQKRSIINLVDLAGSERIHNSGMDEKNAIEGININLGLHYLSRVVIALGNREKEKFIPYRDSLLTMALKSSLGGNCKTRLIATINPDNRYTEQSKATCRFSQNLLAMENKLKKNQFIDPWVIIKCLKKQVEDLKTELSIVKGEEVKEILERDDILAIRKSVNEFVASEDPNATLPLTNRLYIHEYLNYMKSLLSLDLKRKKSQNEKDDPMLLSDSICHNHVSEIKKLRVQVQQKQNEINLLLSVINDRKAHHDDSENQDEGFLPVQDVSESKIAETVVNALLKDNRRKPINITVEEVEKNLIRPLKLNKQDSADDAFKKFKDSHMKTEIIEERDGQIKLKEMKKQVLVKKLKNLKHQRARLHEEIEETKKGHNSKVLQNLPMLSNIDRGVKDKGRVEELEKQLREFDDRIRQKYKDLKTIQLEISRMGLGKNKDTNRVKMQFDSYMQINSDENPSKNNEEEMEIERKNLESEDIEAQVNQQLNSFMLARDELKRKKLTI